jgi:hypothetical protein
LRLCHCSFTFHTIAKFHAFHLRWNKLKAPGGEQVG